MGADKALIRFRGETLIQHVINLLQPVCKSILVSSNNQGYGKFGSPVVPDEILNCGPLGGIYSALKRSTTDWNFVISVDCPFVTKEFVHFLSSKVLRKLRNPIASSQNIHRGWNRWSHFTIKKVLQRWRSPLWVATLKCIISSKRQIQK
ncbi:MAG: molybdenum cofactor guanylyltransferase [Chlorobi bacterium]|nr:molybdenum cofactor guanylyltransferase [Chlorobiota bacterium]